VVITNQVQELIEEHSTLLKFGSVFHGLDHWQRVERNALYLAQFNNADKKVLSYFAYLHDVMRENDGRDLGHGPRAAAFIMKYRDSFPLSDNQFKQLKDACKGHTVGQRPDCITINTCWDADRLDLGRVGITPDSKYLFNAEAKRIADENDYKVLEDFLLN
jgi:uncharacterized protein